MKQRTQAVVGEEMRKQKKVKLKLIKGNDALGLCRLCIYCDTTNLPKSIGIGSPSYYKAICDSTKKPCFKTRSSLIYCSLYRSELPKKHTLFIFKLFKAFINNNWNELKG